MIMVYLSLFCLSLINRFNVVNLTDNGVFVSVLPLTYLQIK